MTRNREPVLHDKADETPALSSEPERRQALKRLSLAAGIAYAAPVLLSLRTVQAQESGDGEGGKGDAPGWNKPTKPEKPSKPDQPDKTDAKDP